jgi:hypothetical protein
VVPLLYVTFLPPMQRFSWLLPTCLIFLEISETDSPGALLSHFYFGIPGKDSLG